MGIPYFFRKIVNDFPEIINSKNTLEFNNTKINNLFLDFNCCIHSCSNELKSTKIYNSHDDFEKDLIQEVLLYIDLIFDFVKPTELFYISIDGIPPRSKMVQQRNRRFMSSWRNKKLIEVFEKENTLELNNEISKIKNEWNSSAISPGTKFMNALSDAINKKITTEKKYKYIKSILSDSHHNGEGEFKIFKYIYDNNLNENLSKNNVIYGLDADLIMLSLISNTNIYLLREPMFLDLINKEDPFLYVNINNLNKNISLYYKDYFPTDNKYLINYYVFLCFLLGNDFIPHLSFLNLKNNGLETLLMYYKKVSIEINENILFITKTKKTLKYQINYNFLSILFNYLSQIENKELFEVSEQYYNKRPYIKKCSNKIEYYKNSLELFPLNNKSPNLIKLGKDGWHSRYYYYLFDTTDGKDIKNICLNYLESLEFTLDYYFHQKYHKTWYYRYNYSPTILDVSNYLLSLSLSPSITSMKCNIDSVPISPLDNIFNQDIINNTEKKHFKINIEYNELYPDINITIPLQLLMILPPSSKHLIENTEHRELMTNINKGVLHYYPNNFNVDTYLKKWLWLCEPKLPDIDIKLLHSKI
jgi:5'-3' exonuclease